MRSWRLISSLGSDLIKLWSTLTQVLLDHWPFPSLAFPRPWAKCPISKGWRLLLSDYRWCKTMQSEVEKKNQCQNRGCFTMSVRVKRTPKSSAYKYLAYPALLIVRANWKLRPLKHPNLFIRRPGEALGAQMYLRASPAGKCSEQS